jgi:hypothetical protein
MIQTHEYKMDKKRPAWCECGEYQYHKVHNMGGIKTDRNILDGIEQIIRETEEKDACALSFSVGEEAYYRICDLMYKRES